MIDLPKQNVRRFLPLVLVGMLGFLAACEKDLCKDLSCENGGSCVEGECQCPDGFNGNFCESFDLQRFFGTYDITYEGCFTTSENHNVSLEQIPGESSRFLIHNLGDYECPAGKLTIEAQANANTIEIEKQTIDCGPIAYTFEGSGTFASGSSVSLSFTVTYDAGGFEQVDNCTAALGK